MFPTLDQHNKDLHHWNAKTTLQSTHSILMGVVTNNSPGTLTYNKAVSLSVSVVTNAGII